MNINDARLIISAVSKSQYPAHDLPEVLLLGRSNVGKSSFINAIINRKSLAKTSSQPGKTRTINFYNIGDQFCFVDVPGYGFAKVSKSERQKFKKMIEEYIYNRKNLTIAIQLIDFRHKPTDDDVSIHKWLVDMGIYPLVVATKLDKVKRSQYHKNVLQIAETLELEDIDDVIPFSSLTKQGREDVIEIIEEVLYKVKDEIQR